MEWILWGSYFSIKLTRNVNMYNVKYATTQLGEYYRYKFPNSKESAYKLGVCMIYEYLDKKVSKRQIKVFTNKCNGRIRERISVPYSSMKIFEALTSLIDGVDGLKKSCKSNCENCVNAFQSIYCRDKMMYDFYMLFYENEDNFNKLTKERIMREVYLPMEEFKHICE